LTSKLRFTYVAETPVTLTKINYSTINQLLKKFPETNRLFKLCAAADIALELLKNSERFSEFTSRKLRTLVRNSELQFLKDGDKQHFAGSTCILIKGQAITDDQDILFTAPAILSDCNVRGKGEAVILIMP